MMKKTLKLMRWLLLLSGILIVILGITMLFTPLQSLVALALFIGISMLISGISEIVSFCNEEKGGRSRWMMASGMITALLGIWTIFGRGAGTLAAILPFVFAAWVISSSIMRVVGSVSLRSGGLAQWGWLLAFGVLGTIFGIFLLFSPVVSGMIVAFTMAGMLIFYGANNILLFFRVKKIADHVRGRLAA